jgi:hypothetical protein
MVLQRSRNCGEEVSDTNPYRVTHLTQFRLSIQACDPLHGDLEDRQAPALDRGKPIIQRPRAQRPSGQFIVP